MLSRISNQEEHSAELREIYEAIGRKQEDIEKLLKVRFHVYDGF